MAISGRSTPITRRVQILRPIPEDKLSFSDSDTGAGVDAEAVGTVLPNTDSGAGSDSSSPITVASSTADTGAGSDNPVLATTNSNADTATGTDAAILVINLGVTDSGAGSDSQTGSAALTGPDTGTGTDATTGSAVFAMADRSQPVSADTVYTPILSRATARWSPTDHLWGRVFREQNLGSGVAHMTPGTQGKLPCILDGSLNCLGTSGAAGTPDSAALSILGNYEMRADVSAQWLSGPSGSQRIIDKNNLDYGFVLNSGSASGPQIGVYTTDATPTVTNIISTGRIPGLANWQRIHVRAVVTVNGASSSVSFYYRTANPDTTLLSDNTGWTLLETKTGTLAAANGIRDTVGPLWVGTTGGAAFLGRIYRAIVTDSGSGTTVASPDFTGRVNGTAQLADAQGNVWNVGGTTAANQSLSSVSGGAYIQGPRSGSMLATGARPAMNPSGDVMWLWKTTPVTLRPSTVMWIGGRWMHLGSSGWGVRVNTDGTLSLFISTTGSDSASVASGSAIPSNLAGSPLWIRVSRVVSTGVVTFEYSTDGTNFTSLGTATLLAGSAIYTSLSPLVIGQRGDNTNLWAGTVSTFQQWNSVNNTNLAVNVDLSKVTDQSYGFTDSTGFNWRIINPALGAFDPRHVVAEPQTFIDLPVSNTAGSGVSGNGLTVPDDPTLRVTGDLTLVWYGAPDLLPNAASSMAIIAKRATSGQYAYRITISQGTIGGNLLPVLELDLSGNGTTESGSYSGIIPAVNGQPIWLRVSWNATTKAVSYDYSDDGIHWTSLGIGSNSSINVASIFAGTDQVEIGGLNTLTGSRYSGRFYRAQIWAGSSKVLDVDASQAVPTSSTFTAITGQTVTINRNAGVDKRPTVVTKTGWVFGADDFFATADDDRLDPALTTSFSVAAAIRRNYVSTSEEVILAKQAAATNTQAGYRLGTTTGSATSFLSVGDGTNGIAAITSGVLTNDGSDVVLSGRRNVVSDKIGAFALGFNKAESTDPTSATSANTDEIRIGRRSGSSGGQWNGECYGAAIWIGEALSDTDMSLLQPEMFTSYAPNDAASISTSLPQTDSGAGTDATIMANVITNPDSGAGSDANAFPVAVMTTPDTGSGSEGVPVIALGSTDSSAGSDNTIVATVLSDADSGAGANAELLTTSLSTADSGAGSETETITAVLSTPDTGVGSESTVIAVVSSTSDTGTGSDATVIATALVTTDSGAGSNAESLITAITTADSGAGSDAQAATYALIGADSGSGSESTASALVFSTSDSGSSTDGTQLSAAESSTDSDIGFAADSAAVTAEVSSTSDTAAGSDAAVLQATYVGTDAGAGTNAESEATALTGPDTGAGSETQITATTLTTADSGAGSNAETESTVIPTTDSASGSNTESIAAVLTTPDSGAGSESTSIATALTTPDTGAGTDTPTVAASLSSSDTNRALNDLGTTVTPILNQAVARWEAKDHLFGRILRDRSTPAFISDSFNRPDSTSSIGTTDSGQLWNIVSGIWGISNGRAYVSANGNINAAAMINTGSSDGTLACTVTNATGAWAGLWFRQVDWNNFWLLQITDSNQIQLLRTINGSVSTMATWAWAGATTATLRLSIRMLGTLIEVTANGTVLGSVTDSNMVTATTHGLRHFGVPNASVRFDNFSMVGNSPKMHAYAGTTKLAAIIDGGLDLPGVNGAYASTSKPTATSMSDFELTARLAMKTWLPSGSQRILSINGSAGNRAWEFYVNGSGQLAGALSIDGTTQVFPSSGVALPFADGTTQWIKITRNATTGLISFYSASDSSAEPTSWTARGTANSSTGALFASTAPLEVGSSVGGTNTLQGRIYAANLRSSIGGTVVASPDFTSLVNGTPVFADAQANLWTIVGNPNSIQGGAYRLGAPSSTASWVGTGYQPKFSPTNTLEGIVKLTPVGSWKTVQSLMVMSRWVGTGNKRSWRFWLSGGSGTMVFDVSADGINTTLDVAGNVDLSTVFANNTTGWIRFAINLANRQVSLYYSTDGVTWTLDKQSTAGAAIVPFGTDSPIELGSSDLGTQFRYQGAISQASLVVDGVLVTNPDFSVVPDQAPRFTDAQGNNWVAQGIIGAGSTADPALLYAADGQHIYLPSGNTKGTAASSSNYLSVPDSADLRLTGDIEVGADLAPDKWTPASALAIVHKWTTSGQLAYRFSINAAGTLVLLISLDGTTQSTFHTSPLAVPAVDGQRVMVRAQRIGATGACSFAYSIDSGTSWVSLGTHNGVAGNTFAGTDAVSIGGAAFNGLAAFAGRIYKVWIAPVGSARVFDMDCTAVSPTATTFLDNTGKTVTINRAADPARKTVVVTKQGFLLGTDDYFEANNDTRLNSTNSGFSFSLAYRRAFPAGATATYISKRTDGGNASTGWSARNYSSSVFGVQMSNGTSQTSPNATTANPSFSNIAGVGVRDVGSSLLRSYATGAVQGTAADPGGSFANTLNLRIGAMSGGTEFSGMEFYGGAVWQKVLTASDVSALDNEFFGASNNDEASLTTVGTPTDSAAGSDQSAIAFTTTDAGSGNDLTWLAAALNGPDTGTGSEVFPSFAIAISDSAAGSDQPIVQTALNDADSAAGNDVGSLAAAYVGADSGLVTESTVSSAVLTTPDTASGSDAPFVAAVLANSDTASGSDTESLVTLLSGPDVAAGSEAQNLISAIVTADSGSGADTTILVTSVNAADAGVGTNAQSILAALSDNESGVGLDAELLTVLHAMTEIGSGSESSTLVALLSMNDAGVGTNVEVATTLFNVAETGVLSESTLSVASITADDTGNETESSILTTDTAKNSADTGTGLDAATIVVEMDASDTGVGSEVAFPIVTFALVDSGAVSDSIFSRTRLSDDDVFAGTDLVVTFNLLSDDENGVGTDELAALIARLSSTEAGSATDLNTLKAVYVSNDNAVGTDTSALTTLLISLDSGAGTEFIPTIGLFGADVGSGSESESASALMFIFEFAAGLETPDVLALLESFENAEGFDTIESYGPNLLDFVGPTISVETNGQTKVTTGGSRTGVSINGSRTNAGKA